MNKIIISLISLLSLAIILIILPYVSLTGYAVLENTQNAMTLGVMLPLTGPMAEKGNNIKNAIELAFRDADLGNLKIVFEDSRCDEKQAKIAVSRLIKINNVSAIIGDFCSNATLAASTLAEINKIVLISPASTSSLISSAGEYTFRTAVSDSQKGELIATVIYEDENRDLAILHDSNNLALAEETKKNFEKLVAQVVFSGVLNEENIKNLKETRADSLYIINSQELSPNLIVSLNSLNPEIKIYVSEYAVNKDIRINREIKAISFANYQSSFIQEYTSEFNKQPEEFTAEAYDAFNALALAIKQNAKSGSDIKNRLYLMNFPGASGPVSFDANGDRVPSYKIYTIDNSKIL